MGDLNTAVIERYRNSFLKEVEANVEEGEWVKMCMQCGVCAGSCPLGNAWEHSPQKIFMMIRAGQREQSAAGCRRQHAWQSQAEHHVAGHPGIDRKSVV